MSTFVLIEFLSEEARRNFEQRQGYDLYGIPSRRCKDPCCLITKVSREFSQREKNILGIDSIEPFNEVTGDDISS